MTSKSIVPDAAALGPNLTAEQTRVTYSRGEEAVVFALLELAARLRRPQGQCASVSPPATPGFDAVHRILLCEMAPPPLTLRPC